ncbi:uncharacterized protein BJX67DRAFT_113486 [Aspergillus lucknowensis]|uniref:Uncharacterized protein n=1 Tax=Aspergillus lucknowensis TaxID=176173 RepID=A0ABR4LRE0_9EURO
MGCQTMSVFLFSSLLRQAGSSDDVRSTTTAGRQVFRATAKQQTSGRRPTPSSLWWPFGLMFSSRDCQRQRPCASLLVNLEMCRDTDSPGGQKSAGGVPCSADGGILPEWSKKQLSRLENNIHATAWSPLQDDLSHRLNPA